MNLSFFSFSFFIHQVFKNKKEIYLLLLVSSSRLFLFLESSFYDNQCNFSFVYILIIILVILTDITKLRTIVYIYYYFFFFFLTSWTLVQIFSQNKNSNNIYFLGQSVYLVLFSFKTNGNNHLFVITMIVDFSFLGSLSFIMHLQ